MTDPDGGVTRYTYDAAGNLVRTDLPNGTVETREYDDLNRLMFLENRNAAGVISSFSYTLARPAAATRSSRTRGRRVDYSYDALDRLTREKIIDAVFGDRTIDYTYDAVGNRLTPRRLGRGADRVHLRRQRPLLTETLAGAGDPVHLRRQRQHAVARQRRPIRSSTPGTSRTAWSRPTPTATAPSTCATPTTPTASAWPRPSAARKRAS